MSIPTNQPISAPTLAETQAINNADLGEQIRDLVAQIQATSALGFDPSTFTKGKITAIDYTSSPPTVSVQVGGATTVTIPGVRLMSDYSPVVNQTVHLVKQGADFFVLGHLADTGGTAVGPEGSGWVSPELTNGSHFGNSNGQIFYRLILEHGSWKMQWRGGWAVSGTFMIDTADALPTHARPTSKRSLLAARQIQGGSVAVQFDFHTDGRVQMIGDTTSPLSATVSGDVGFGGGTSGNTAFGGAHNHVDSAAGLTTTDGSHIHSFSTGSHDHSFSGGGHTHPVNTPTWVSLNGLEYFL